MIGPGARLEDMIVQSRFLGKLRKQREREFRQKEKRKG
jgi:hypothetical protein